ncbi:MAG: hypothetical protein NWE94_10370 [Candidatus Bathyarchaeota archaeon]|nr:hypothetical protein [Candidatus Bathyarchaeota archaeon]
MLARKPRTLVAVLCCMVILGAIVACIFTIDSSLNVEIGIFYYVWYDPCSEVSWDNAKIVDEPILGFYNSCDSAVIRQHIFWLSELDVDFVVVSWWGLCDSYGRFTDAAAKAVFKLAGEIGDDLKFAIMVEPYNRSGDFYDYAAICAHVYDEFVSPFPSVYYNGSKPFLFFFNDKNLTKNGSVPLVDDRFNIVLVGHEPYCQWIYTDLNCHAKPARIPYTAEISVTPRYDDSRVRSPNCIVNADLSQTVYDEEWKNAIRLLTERRIDTIMITSWNEYPERTAIEPHYDATAHVSDPFFLYNQTKDYIKQARSLTK